MIGTNHYTIKNNVLFNTLFEMPRRTETYIYMVLLLNMQSHSSPLRIVTSIDSAI